MLKFKNGDEYEWGEMEVVGPEGMETGTVERQH